MTGDKRRYVLISAAALVGLLCYISILPNRRSPVVEIVSISSADVETAPLLEAFMLRTGLTDEGLSPQNPLLDVQCEFNNNTMDRADDMRVSKAVASEMCNRDAHINYDDCVDSCLKNVLIFPTDCYVLRIRNCGTVPVVLARNPRHDFAPDDSFCTKYHRFEFLNGHTQFFEYPRLNTIHGDTKHSRHFYSLDEAASGAIRSLTLFPNCTIHESIAIPIPTALKSSPLNCELIVSIALCEMPAVAISRYRMQLTISITKLTIQQYQIAERLRALPAH